jgi:EXPERA (EXPanded EBP superfamily)
VSTDEFTRKRAAGYSVEKSFTLALESFNTVVSQWFNAWLIYAIVKRRYYRHVLQATLATYTTYGTFLYYYVAHLSGYAVMETHGVYPYLMFYLCNAPWLLGYGWMAFDSIREIARHYARATEGAPESRLVVPAHVGAARGAPLAGDTGP